MSLTEQVSTASVAVSTLVSPSRVSCETITGMTVSLVQWDTSGISVFFFPRSSIPADISAGAPQPSNWGPAMARWPAISCDPFKFFYDHVAIFDTTLWYVLFLFGRTGLTRPCPHSGDWAAGVWSSSGIPGQEQSCAARTGYSTCQDFVQNDGNAFKEACTSFSNTLQAPFIHLFRLGNQIIQAIPVEVYMKVHSRFAPLTARLSLVELLSLKPTKSRSFNTAVPTSR